MYAYIYILLGKLGKLLEWADELLSKILDGQTDG